MTIIAELKGIFEKALKSAFPDAPLYLDLAPATQEKFGHYQFNGSMKLGKALKKNPREVAETLSKAIENPIFEKIEVAGPGFINLTLSKGYLSEKLNQKAPLDVKAKEKQRVIVEFSSPNVAKEMHVGHLRSTIIGDSIARLFEFLGHDVIRLNHIGDWGTAFGMLIAYMREVVPEVLEGRQKADLHSLMTWYRASKKRFDEDEAFKERARRCVVLLQAGDPEILKAWKLIKEVSMQAYEEVYLLLDVKLTERGESFYNPMLGAVVQDLEKKGLVVVSEGAKCVFHESHEIPLMVQKSDGGYNYDTTDIAAIRYRAEVDRANRIIVVVDAGQSLHFELIRKTAEKAGYIEDVRFDHVPFGVVLGQDGKKFKTRSGETEKLIDLITAAIDEAKRQILSRDPDQAEIETLARVLGIDAIKYADLASNRINDYVFSYERMLKFEGNTATFILYSFVRIAGIKRKAGVEKIEGKIVLEHPAEVDLGLHLLRFGETIEAYASELYPHYLSDYLYNLALKFNVFFRDCRVVGSPEQNSRLLLCDQAAEVMETGIHILGLKTVEKM
jgi:arginyl-tRNA synthetase